MSFNKVIMLGNLTRDPALRQTQSGAMICNFSIAMSRKFQGQDGSTKEETCFVEVEAFGKTAENIAKFFAKGKPILVEGRLKQESWQDKDTQQKRTKHKIALERFDFVVSAKNAHTTENTQTSYSAPASDADLEDDDVPF